jgi:hypothetical protein
MPKKIKQTRAPQERRPRSRARWIYLPLLALIVLLGVGVWIANPSLPRSTELDAVSLDLPATAPPAPGLRELLRGRHIYGQLPTAIDEAQRAISAGRWLSASADVLEELQKLKPPLEKTVRAALLAPGCLPVESMEPKKEEQVSYLPLLRGARLLVVEAVARMQNGEPAAIRDLMVIHDRLIEIEQRCASNVLATVVIGVALGSVHQAWGYALALPQLDAALQGEIWRRLVALEERPCPMPMALRWEARWLRQLIEADYQTDQRARDQKMTWPWYDRQDTLQISALLTKREIWVAGHPPDSPVWSKRFPEEDYFERMSNAPRLLNILRFNSAGKALVGIARPSLRRYALRWYQSRCYAAAERARWIADLRARGRTLTEDATRLPPRDPFRDRVFTAPEPKTFVCAVSEKQRPTHKDSLSAGLQIVALPPAPAGQPTSAPASE